MDAVIHFELPCDDRERISRFFRQAFGWNTQMLGPEMGHYVVVTTAETDARPDGPRGAINGGFFTRTPSMPEQHPGIVIAVEDIRAAMQRVGAAGGQVLGEPMDIPGVGAYVAFLDTEGNRSSMLQPLPMGAR
ncbi:MAG TPA: VOC family protein [Ramlibacter sp.]|jgi:predicted enzyme related to lactoylglutathione lyase|uniref:VOC family protein n=1 Tax=Ramlibacter sp. TaxID=1917967 RepID=UPI002D4C9170|nr:VOC family protein [Ramlibacter sp.]HZY17501.1 VOC family protein [Ramlibacter sp.]